MTSDCKISNEWKYRDMETVVMENEDLRIVVLSGKGTDITEITYKPLNLNLLFSNPYGPRNPMGSPPISPHREMFRDYTGGGWSDILPNAGLASEYGGASFGLHDETPLLRWSSEVTESSPSKVSASFEVDLVKYPFTVQKSIGLGQSNELEIAESVTNASNQDLPFSWLIHPTFSRTFAGPGAAIDTHGQRIHRLAGPRVEEWNFPSFTEPNGVARDFRIVPPNDSVINDTVVLSGLEEGRYSIYNPELRLRFTLRWPVEVFRYLWYYRNFNSAGYPYYGRSSFLALEPCTCMRSGLSAQVGAGEAVLLPAGKTISARLTAVVDSPGA